MRRIAATLLLGSFLGAAPTRIVMEAPVSASTVYQDRALVTRAGVATLEKGQSLLVFENVPAQIDADSLRLEGTGAVTLVDLKLRTEYQIEPVDERLRALYERKQGVDDEIVKIANAMRVIEAERKLVDTFREKYFTLALMQSNSGIAEPRKWSEITEYVSKRQADSLQAEFVQNQSRRKLEAERARIEQEIRSLGSGRRTEKRVAEALVECSRAEILRLKLSYLVGGPSWDPIYDLRLERTNRALTLTAFGSVQQATGEDWTNVYLRLSTARPDLTGKAPELPPWILKEKVVYQPRPVYSRKRAENAMDMERSMSAGAPAPSPAVAAEKAMAEEVPPPPMSAGGASTEGGAGAQLFVLEKPATVERDNAARKLFLFERTLPAAFRYVAVPKLSPYAYLRAAASNAGEATLLPGSASVFVDGSYLAKTDVPLVAPDEDFPIDLGVDESIQVERRLLKRFQEADTITGMRRITWRYLFKVRNQRKTAETVLVLDALPASARSDIKITQLEPNAEAMKKGVARIGENNRFEWQVNLAGGERSEIVLSYLVEYPKNLPIDGLD